MIIKFFQNTDPFELVRTQQLCEGTGFIVSFLIYLTPLWSVNIVAKSTKIAIQVTMRLYPS